MFIPAGSECDVCPSSSFTFRGVQVIAATVGPYRVIEKLGAGGMGEVYLAEDPRLGRRVALKTIAGSANAASRARLVHEARAAAALNHPNIAAIYDILEQESDIYIVMEFVDGSTLANRVRYGPMVPDEALEITTQILEALMHAHAHGVIHRDLKPANVSIAAGGKVKILDFGIAHTHPAEVRTTIDDTTGAGRVFGTPGYCAPEQLVGGVADERSDLYSVGVLLFELIAGHAPFAKKDLLAAAMSSVAQPPALSSAAPQTPAAIDALVAKAMAPEPERRYQSASEMLAAVRALTRDVSEHPTIDGGMPIVVRRAPAWTRRAIGIAAALALTALAAMPLARYWRTSPRAGEPTGPTTIAVLPLDNLSGSAANDYLGAGMAETISTTLAQHRELVVISRSEISKAAAAQRDVFGLARDLGVKYLIQGGVQKLGDTLQVTVRVVTPDGRTLWGDQYHDSMVNLFDLQARAAAGIGAFMHIRAEPVLASQPAEADVLPDYWQGRELFDHRDVKGNLARAIEAFERVVDRAPRYPPGHAALGEAYWAQYNVTNEPSWTTRAIAEATTAVDLGPNDAQARYSLAVIYYGSGKLDEAEHELQRVTDAQPSHPDAPRLLGNVLGDRGRTDDAVKAFQRAINLRPEFAGNYRDLGRMLLTAGRYPDAEQAFENAIARSPNTADAYQQVGTLYHTMGRIDEAIAKYQEALKHGQAAEAWNNLGIAFYQQRRYAEAADAYEHALRISDTSPVRHRNLADLYRRLGREADARAEYQKAIDQTQVRLGVNPRDVTDLSRLAVYEAKLGRFDEATRHLDAALTIKPGDNGALFRQGVVLTMQRQYDTAMKALIGAVKAGYSRATIRDDEDLAPLKARPDFKTLVESK